MVELAMLSHQLVRKTFGAFQRWRFQALFLRLYLVSIVILLALLHRRFIKPFLKLTLQPVQFTHLTTCANWAMCRFSLPRDDHRPTTTDQLSLRLNSAHLELHFSRSIGYILEIRGLIKYALNWRLGLVQRVVFFANLAVLRRLRGLNWVVVVQIIMVVPTFKL